MGVRVDTITVIGACGLALAAACEASERAMRGTTQQRFLLAHERFG